VCDVCMYVYIYIYNHTHTKRIIVCAYTYLPNIHNKLNDIFNCVRIRKMFHVTLMEQSWWSAHLIGRITVYQLMHNIRRFCCSVCWSRSLYHTQVCPCFTHEILHINDAISSLNCAAPISITSQKNRLFREALFVAAFGGVLLIQVFCLHLF
jgi:hypothetical protein